MATPPCGSIVYISIFKQCVKVFYIHFDLLLFGLSCSFTFFSYARIGLCELGCSSTLDGSFSKTLSFFLSGFLSWIHLCLHFLNWIVMLFFVSV